jgi:hypothetical protein
MQSADDPVISESLKNALGKAQSQVIYSRKVRVTQTQVRGGAHSST